MTMLDTMLPPAQLPRSPRPERRIRSTSPSGRFALNGSRTRSPSPRGRRPFRSPSPSSGLSSGPSPIDSPKTERKSRAGAQDGKWEKQLSEYSNSGGVRERCRGSNGCFRRPGVQVVALFVSRQKCIKTSTCLF